MSIMHQMNYTTTPSEATRSGRYAKYIDQDDSINIKLSVTKLAFTMQIGSSDTRLPATILASAINIRSPEQIDVLVNLARTMICHLSKDHENLEHMLTVLSNEMYDRWITQPSIGTMIDL